MYNKRKTRELDIPVRFSLQLYRADMPPSRAGLDLEPFNFHKERGGEAPFLLFRELNNKANYIYYCISKKGSQII